MHVKSLEMDLFVGGFISIDLVAIKLLTEGGSDSEEEVMTRKLAVLRWFERRSLIISVIALFAGMLCMMIGGASKTNPVLGAVLVGLGWIGLSGIFFLVCVVLGIFAGREERLHNPELYQRRKRERNQDMAMTITHYGVSRRSYHTRRFRR